MVLQDRTQTNFELLTAFFAGNDLPSGRTVTQVQMRFGVVFDAP